MMLTGDYCVIVVGEDDGSVARGLGHTQVVHFAIVSSCIAMELRVRWTIEQPHL